ncbi:pectate lyase [Stieleria varia]|uniref:Pectic acid lyase n=1 Tax=Stieleria varia TaxID=2528005 RepID=A0A5C6AXZ4_9BACT|nr:pectate lyase [Stieleria varia]TWU04327.1 Pectic acid lyase [Stieleria varia]
MPSQFLFMIVALMPAALLTLEGSAHAAPKDFLDRNQAWFAGDEAKRIASNILSFQSDLGGWPKNLDTTERPFTGDRTKLKGTYDNGATTDELRFLGRIYTATNEQAYRDAFDRGLDYVLRGQYENGGWPQLSPPGTGYHRHITFNDGAMVRLLSFVREVATTKAYLFVDDERRQTAANAFDRGIECILKCQIRVDGALTVWCAQHDEIDFRAQSGRAYELATLSGSESVGITRLLMSIENPTPEIVKSVEAAVAWFEKAKLQGIRLVKEKDQNGPKGVNLVVVADPKASPLWARFYDIHSNTPVFVDRDGVPKQAVADIGYERRNGYAWYGNWPQKLLDREYLQWKQRIAAKPNL